MGTSTARVRDPVAKRPGDQMMGRPGDVRGAPVIHVYFKSNAELYQTCFDRLLKTL